jgi:hypothetical protein
VSDGVTIRDNGFEGVRRIHLAQETGLSAESRDHDIGLSIP